MPTKTPQDWANEVGLHTRRPGEGEKTPLFATDWPAMYCDIVRVINCAVNEAVQEAAKAEREACAALAEEMFENGCDSKDIADSIRERGT